MNHNPVGSPVDPAFFRITGDVDTARSYIAAAVKVVPFGGREFKEIHIFIFIDIFEEWAFLYELWRDRLDLLISLPPSADEIHFGFSLRDVQSNNEFLPST